MDDLTVIKYGDLVAETAGGQAVADIDCGLITDYFIKLGVDLCFGNVIKSSGGLVENNKWRVLIECASKGNLLSFTARYVYAFIVKGLIIS